MILQLCLCAAVAGFLYREMGEGLKRLFSLAPTQLSISVLGVIAALGHGLLQIPQVGSGEGFVFFGPAAALGLLAAVWSRDLRLGLHLDHVHRLADCPVKQQLEIIKDPRVARIIKAELGEELTAARDLVLIRRERTESTFDTQRILERKNNAESWSEKMTPFMVVAIIVATAVVMLLTRQGGELLTVFTIFTITMVPLCAHFAPVSPMLWARRRFPTSVILNNTEAEAFSHCDGLLFQDSDLFDKDCLILKGIRVLGENNKIDELMVDVASVLCHLDIGLGSLFLPIIKNDLSLLKEVTKTGCYRGEGVRATVGGEELVIGTFEYMQKCGHLSPYAKKKEQAENSKIKNIYVAKGNELSCIFTVGYVVRGNTKLELDSLYKNSINIILDSRDMNLTKKNLIRMFGVEEDGIFTVDTRGQDQKKKPENKRKKGVYTLEDNLFSFADTIWACRHMKGMEWRNIMIHLVLSVISFVLFFALMAVGGIDQVTVENTLLYLLICCIPFVLNSVI
jgi:hypothetical protein